MIYFQDSGDGCPSMYEFSVNEEDKRIDMHYFSGDQGWSSLVRGEIAMYLRDTGDGIILHTGKRLIKLNYGDAEEVRLLLNFLNEDTNFQKFISKTTKFKRV